MSSYYTRPSTRSYASRRARDDSDLSAAQWPLTTHRSELAIDPSSVFIFPAPATEPPSPNVTDDLGSAISIPTSLSLSASPFPSVSTGTRSRTLSATAWEDIGLSSAVALSDDVEVWDWSGLESPASTFDDEWLHTANPANTFQPGPNSLLFSGLTRPRTRPLDRSPPPRRFLGRMRTRSLSPQPAPALQPTITLPFLSFLASLFSFDSETVYLLTHSDHSPALFPSSPQSSSTEPEAELPSRDTFQTLLRPEKETSLLKKGFAIAAELSTNPFAYVPTLGLLSLPSIPGINPLKVFQRPDSNVKVAA